MSFPYADLQADALELIVAAGRPITLRHPTLPAIETTGAFLDAELNVATPGAQQRRGGGSAQESSAFYYVPDVGVDLDTKWFIVDGGVRHEITRARAEKPGPTTVFNQLFVGA